MPSKNALKPNQADEELRKFRAKTIARIKQKTQEEKAKKEKQPESFDPEEIREFRSKTVARIKVKLRDNEIKDLIENEERKREERAFRLKWRENVKKQYAIDVMEQVDKQYVQRIIPLFENKNNRLVSKNNLEFMQEKQKNENELNELVSDLTPTEDKGQFDHKRDSGMFLFTVGSEKNGSKKPAVEFSSNGANASLAVKYLHNIESFDLSVRSKLLIEWAACLEAVRKGEPFINHRHSAHKNRLPMVRTISASSIKSNSNSIKSNELNEKSDNQMIATSDKSSSVDRKASNRKQITELLDDLLDDEESNSNGLGNNREVAGLMRKLLQNAKNPIWKTPKKLDSRSRIDKSILNTKASQEALLLSVMPQLNRDKSGAGMKSEASGGSNQNSQGNSLHAKIVDACFLIGPTKTSILDAYYASANNKSPNEGDGKSLTVDPSVLFMQYEVDFPAETAGLLPLYCFPR